MPSAHGLDRFGDQMIAILPQLMQEIARYENNYVTTGKITCQQFVALSKIMEQDEWTMNELAKAMKVSFPAMTGLVDRLVNHRLVVRSREARDRRVVRVAVTSKGRKIVREVYAQKRQGIINIFGRLTGPERQQYLDILEKLVHKLNEGAATR